MPKFYYKARNRKGAVVRGDIEAADLIKARRRVSELDLIPIDIGSFSLDSLFEGVRTRLSQLFFKVPLEEMLVFTNQLQTAYSVGIPIIDALSVIEQQTEHPALKKALEQITNDVKDGQPLHVAFGKHPAVFEEVYVSMLRAGELSGELENFLSRIAFLLERQAETRAKVKSATFYPKIVIFFMIAVTLGLVYFIIPKLKTFLASYKMDLPPLTKLVIGTSDLFINNWYIVFPAIAALIFGFKSWVATPAGRKTWDTIKLKVPVMGPLFMQIELNSFCIILNLLLKAGIPIIEALQTVQGSLSNSVVAQEFESCQTQIKSGGKMSAGMKQSQIFPLVFTNLISMGEESGKLDLVLEKIARYYKIQIDYKLDNLSKLIEPILLAIIFVLVLIIALSIFMPIWQMSKAFK